MCATYFDNVGQDDFETFLELAPPEGYVLPALQYPGYNVRLVAVDKEGKRKARVARWGLVPSWAKEPGTIKSTFNARAETLEAKPAFRTPFQRRRCVLVGTSYFEWIGEKGSKKPVRFQSADGSPLLFAGLWDFWKDGEREILSCSMVTTEPNGLATLYHNRMPALLEPDLVAGWLDVKTPLEECQRMLAPVHESMLSAEVIERAELEALAPVAPPEAPTLDL